MLAAARCTIHRMPPNGAALRRLKQCRHPPIVLPWFYHHKALLHIQTILMDRAGHALRAASFLYISLQNVATVRHRTTPHVRGIEWCGRCADSSVQANLLPQTKQKYLSYSHQENHPAPEYSSWYLAPLLVRQLRQRRFWLLL